MSDASTLKSVFVFLCQSGSKGELEEMINITDTCVMNGGSVWPPHVNLAL